MDVRFRLESGFRSRPSLCWKRVRGGCRKLPPPWLRVHKSAPRLNNFSPYDYSPSIGWKIAAVKAGKAAASARANQEAN